MKMLTLDDVSAGIRELPALPVVVVQLLESFNNDQVDTAALGRQIAQDQALVARVLRVANSSFYGMQGKVASMQDAIVVLGFRSVRTLVVAAAVTGSFPSTNREWFDQQAFWKHSLAVGLAARTFADAFGINGDHAFTAGLLHDIGRQVMVTCFAEHYRAVVELRSTRDCFTSEAEQAVLGFDHTQVGAALAARWKFAPAIAEAVRLHHAISGEDAPAMPALIHLADVTAHVLDLTGDPAALVPPLDTASWNRLGVGWAEYKRRLATIDSQHRSAALMLAA